MKMYHGTNYTAWEAIQKEGFLWGRKDVYWCGNLMDRVNYLATKQEYATKSDVLLEVDFPTVLKCDNWEYITYKPIPLLLIRRIT